jgi:hypothetical protein
VCLTGLPHPTHALGGKTLHLMSIPRGTVGGLLNDQRGLPGAEVRTFFRSRLGPDWDWPQREIAVDRDPGTSVGQRPLASQQSHILVSEEAQPASKKPLKALRNPHGPEAFAPDGPACPFPSSLGPCSPFLTLGMPSLCLGLKSCLPLKTHPRKFWDLLWKGSSLP